MGTSLTQIITISVMESGPDFFGNIFLSVLIPVEFTNVLFFFFPPVPEQTSFKLGFLLWTSTVHQTVSWYPVHNFVTAF